MRTGQFREALILLTCAVTLVGCSSGPGTADEQTSSTPDTVVSSAPTESPTSIAETDPTEATSATSTPTATYRPVYQDSPCPTPNVPGVPQLELGTDFHCGYLTVPENRAVPNGRTIKIAVARIDAIGANPPEDPILYLAGGPGGTGLATAVQRVEDGWNVGRDVIFLDQRGTLHSNPLLACPEIDAFQQTTGQAAMDPATGLADVAATRACRDRLAADDWDLSAYNTAENAADIADLRVALDIDQWNIYGVSYGSDLALQTLRDHPAGIRSLVLDSVVPPSKNLVDGFWPNAAAGYNALFAACAADTACAAAFPDLANEFTTLVGTLAASPRTVPAVDPANGQSVEVAIDGYTLANLVVVLSLRPGALAGVPALIHNLSAGDGTMAATAILGGRPPTGLTGYGLALGVFCSESAAFTNPAQMLAAAKTALPGFPDPVLSLVPQIPRIFDDCAAWDVAAADPAVQQPLVSSVPVLVLAGSLDAITPPAWAQSVTADLPNSQLLTFPGAGHDVMLWSPQCAVSVMQSFLTEPTRTDTGCVDDIQVPAFTTD